MWCRFIFSIAALTVMLLPFDATATVVIDRVPTETTDSMLRSTCSTKQKEKKDKLQLCTASTVTKLERQFEAPTDIHTANVQCIVL